jgi:hypothetical protein
MMLRFACASLVLAGCLISTPPPGGAGVPPGQNECVAVANAATAVLAGDRSADEQGNFDAVVARRCVDDQWSAQARICVLNAHQPEVMHACADQLLTAEQRDRVMAAASSVLDRRDPEEQPMQKPPEEDLAPSPQQHGSQAEIASRLDDEGRQLLDSRHYSDASAKFREAVARVPEARYFYDLCISLGAENHRDEAMTACNAALKVGPNAALRLKVEAELDLLSH